jgi:opacity protein-like surface antigen
MARSFSRLSRVDHGRATLFKGDVLKGETRMARKQPFFLQFRFLTLFILLPIFAGKATLAQTPQQLPRVKFSPETDASIGFMGETTISRDASQVVPETLDSFEYFTKTQSSSTSAGGLLTLHSAFKPWLGLNVNLSYSQFKQSFSAETGTVTFSGAAPTAGGGSDVGSLNTRMIELTAAYAFEGPRIKRFRTFGQFGGGGLIFQPISAYFAKDEARPAMVFGAGTEYTVSRHLSVRAEYRGLLYEGPNYQTTTTGTFPQQRLFTVTNLPAISLVYHFRPSSKEKTLANIK